MCIFIFNFLYNNIFLLLSQYLLDMTILSCYVKNRFKESLRDSFHWITAQNQRLLGKEREAADNERFTIGYIYRYEPGFLWNCPK